MKRAIAAYCCLILAAPPVALAQGASPDKKAPPTSKEMADKKKAIVKQSGLCAQRSRQQNLKQGTKEFNAFMTQCLKEGR